MSNEAIRTHVKVCMFDQYGTVVDMQGGLTAIADAVSQGEGLEGRSQLLRDLVAAHAFREFDDRRAAASRAHALPRDRSSFGRPCHGARRHRAHHGRSPLSRRRNREAQAVSRKCPQRWRGCTPGTGLWCFPTAIPTCSRRPAVSQGRVRPGDLRCRGELVQAACRDLYQGRRASRRCRSTRSCSLPTMRSIASARNPPACAPPSSTAAAGRSATRRTSRTFSCPR